MQTPAAAAPRCRPPPRRPEDDVALPAVITADLRLNEPRYLKMPMIMKARKKTIDEIPVSELGVDTALKVVTLRYSKPAEREGGCTFVESVDALLIKPNFPLRLHTTPSRFTQCPPHSAQPDLPFPVDSPFFHSPSHSPSNSQL